MSHKDTDATPLFVQRMLAQRNGIFLITIRGKRIVKIARCRVPFVPQSVTITTNQTEMYLEQMLAKRAGVFLAHLAAGAIVGLGSVDEALEIAP